MRFPYIVISFVLVSLSAAHPHRNITGPPPVKTVTHFHPDPTSSPTSSPAPTAAPRVAVCGPGLDTAGCVDLPLTKRDGVDWGHVAGQGIRGLQHFISDIFGLIKGKRPVKEPPTVTAPGPLTTITITEGPVKELSTVTAPGTLTTITITEDPVKELSTVTAPGTLTTITITEGPEFTGPVTVTTTLVTVPVPIETKTVPVPVPKPGGCYYARPDGGIEVRPCGDPFDG